MLPHTKTMSQIFKNTNSACTKLQIHPYLGKKHTKSEEISQTSKNQNRADPDQAPTSIS